LLGAAHAHGANRARQRRLQEEDEVALDVLDDVVEGAGFQRRDRHAAVLRAGDDEDRRLVRNRVDALERLDAVQPRHIEVERHHVDIAMGGERRESALAGRFAHDLDALAAEAALDQGAEAFVVVDVENLAWHWLQLGEGTWMTEKNRPSWRMALAKLS